MTVNLLNSLVLLLAKRPLVLLRFKHGFGDAVMESKRGLNRFTIVRRHAELDDLQLPTLCLVEMPDGKIRNCYVGVVTAKAAIATFESRLTIIRLQELKLTSLESVVGQLSTRQFQSSLKAKLLDDRVVTCLSPKLSTDLIKVLAKSPLNRRAIEAAAFYIPRLRKVTAVEWAQTDAIKIAMGAFGVGSSEVPREIDLADDTDSAFEYFDARVLEDNVIARDASVIPGFDLIDKYVTGRAVFEKGGERLDVYTANKGPLEEMLGVDLIYVNEVVGNTVMVQYKMLNPRLETAGARTEWIFRPDDQLQKEMARMKLPTVKRIDDYRLNRSPFYFKFVKRKGNGESHQSFIISLDHLKEILEWPSSLGPKGGVRVSYEALGGSYLREMDLIGLIRSGYIGTHRVESEALNPLIERVSKGDRALVLAWQRRMH
jgi:hypothetical protein